MTHPTSRGFTLVELLVATAVMALLLTLLLQISGNALDYTRASRQSMDTIQRTRATLDSLEADLQNLVSIEGLTIFTKQDALNNTSIAFLTRNRGPKGVSDFRFMAVAYELEAGGNIVRRCQPVSWSSQNPLQDLANTLKNGSASTLADSVLRLEAAFILDDGTIVTPKENGNWLTTSLDGENFPGNLDGFSAILQSKLPLNPSAKRVQALALGAAALESQVYRLPNASAMGSALHTPAPSSNQTPFDVWNTAVSSGLLSTFPQPATKALQVSQRTFSFK